MKLSQISQLAQDAEAMYREKTKEELSKILLANGFHAHSSKPHTYSHLWMDVTLNPREAEATYFGERHYFSYSDFDYYSNPQSLIDCLERIFRDRVLKEIPSSKGFSYDEFWEALQTSLEE